MGKSLFYACITAFVHQKTINLLPFNQENINLNILSNHGKKQKTKK